MLKHEHNANVFQKYHILHNIQVCLLLVMRSQTVEFQILFCKRGDRFKRVSGC